MGSIKYLNYLLIREQIFMRLIQYYKRRWVVLFSTFHC